MLWCACDQTNRTIRRLNVSSIRVNQLPTVVPSPSSTVPPIVTTALISGSGDSVATATANSLLATAASAARRVLVMDEVKQHKFMDPLCRMMTGNGTIESLDVSGNDLQDREVEALLNVVLVSHALTVMALLMYIVV